MKRILLIYALTATLIGGVAVACLRRTVVENDRLKANARALTERLVQAHGQLDSTRASVEVLRLTCREYEALHREDAATIRSLGVRLRRVEAVAKQVTESRLEMQAALRDTLVVRRDTVLLYDTLRSFSWCDPWVTLQGEIRGDTITATLRSVDTLRQILHRVPRRFLFIRWGTKAVRQEVQSSNPHTRLVWSEYLLIER